MTERVYSQNPDAVKQRTRRAAKKAAIASGEIAFEDIPHGTNGYHNYECRCGVCTKAATEARTVFLEKVRKRAREHPEIIPHGTWNAYTNYRCRCQVCRDAEAERAAEKRRRAKAADALSPQDVQELEELRTVVGYRAVIRDLKRDGRFLVIEHFRPGLRGRRIARIRLKDGPRKRGTWDEVAARLAEHALTARAWAPSEDGYLESVCDPVGDSRTG